MRTFETLEDLVTHMADEYDKSKGKTLVSWQASQYLLLVGIYEGDRLTGGCFIYRDPEKGHNWVLIDSVHSDSAIRHYVGYMDEMYNAILSFEETVEPYNETSILSLDLPDNDGEGLDFYENLD